MAFPPELGYIDGAVIDKAGGDAFDADLEAALVDTTSGGGAGSSRTPAQTTAEVIDARDGEPSLLAKLGAMETIFTGVGPSAVRNGLVLGGLTPNNSFLSWPAGDAAAPLGWTLSGTGAAVARCGTGLGDTNVVPGQDHFSAKLTYGSAAAVLSASAIPASLAGKIHALGVNKYPPIVGGTSNARREDFSADIDGQLNAWAVGLVRSDAGNRARLAIYDAGNGPVYGPYHPGDGEWYGLLAGPITTMVTDLQAQCRVEAAGSAYFQLVDVVLTPLSLPPMAGVLPAQWRRAEQTIHLAGTQSASSSARKAALVPRRPIVITDVQLLIETAPTGQALKVDLQVWDGAAWTSMFSTLPEIAAGAYAGGGQPDGTYKLRCLTPMWGAAIAANSACRVMVTQVGSGTAGADLTIVVGYLAPVRPLEVYHPYNVI